MHVPWENKHISKRNLLLNEILHETSKLFYGSALFLRRSTAAHRNFKNEEKNERRGRDLSEQGHVQFLLPKVKQER